MGRRPEVHVHSPSRIAQGHPCPDLVFKRSAVRARASEAVSIPTGTRGKEEELRAVTHHGA